MFEEAPFQALEEHELQALRQEIFDKAIELRDARIAKCAQRAAKKQAAQEKLIARSLRKQKKEDDIRKRREQDVAKRQERRRAAFLAPSQT